jgi:hypothetical protein
MAIRMPDLAQQFQDLVGLIAPLLEICQDTESKFRGLVTWTLKAGGQAKDRRL